MKLRLAIVVLSCCVGLLGTLGLVMLYSAGMVSAQASDWQVAQFFLRQMVWFVLGFGGLVFMASLDYALLKRVVWLLLIVGVILLVLVLIPGVGLYRNGARRWLGWGPVQFQPSEFAKLALILALAAYGEYHSRHMGSWLRGIAVPGLMIGVVCALLFKEPDRGTMILTFLVGGTVIFLAGVRPKCIAILSSIAAAAFVALLIHDPTIIRRFKGWWDLETHKQDSGYQAYEGLKALGRGGPYGLGLGNSRQKMGYLPEHQTDFILGILGEELGLAGTMSVLAIFVVLAGSGFYIAAHARDKFGFLLASGLTTLITMQAIVNVGVVTSALPNKGLPLPFISYGGSNLVMLLTAVGLLISVARHAPPEQSAVSPLGSEELPLGNA